MEQKRIRVKEWFRELPMYVERAADMTAFKDKGPGRPWKLELVQRAMLFFSWLMNKSNRDVEEFPKLLLVPRGVR